MPLSRIADAEENLGESEVREAHLAKSLFYIQIGDKVDKYYEFLFSLVLPFAIISFLSACNFHIWFSLVNSGESIGTTEGNGKQNSRSWAKDGLGVLYTAAWIFLYGFWSYFQEHW